LNYFAPIAITHYQILFLVPYSDYGDVKDNKGVRNFSMFHGHFNLLEHFDFKPSPQIETK
jgi:hypothetical protein